MRLAAITLVLFLNAKCLHGATTSIGTFQNPADGATDEASELYLFNVTLDSATFTIELVISTPGIGTLKASSISSSNDLAIDGGIEDPTADSLNPGETLDFSLSLTGFVPGGSVSSVEQIELSFLNIKMDAANDSSDAGIFSQLNGGSDIFSWSDGNGGADFTGHLGTDAHFNLRMMNLGNPVDSFRHTTTGGEYRVDSISIEYSAVPEVGQPVLGVLLATSLIGARRRKS